MKIAGSFYCLLLRLYPAEHRQAYGVYMLQHARDLGKAARQRGRWSSAKLLLRLLFDAIANAAIEHLEGNPMANKSFSPLPWLSVLLAVVPGALMALSRAQLTRLDPLMLVLGYAYLGLLVVGLLYIWRQRRRFPVWGLLPAGMLVWYLTLISAAGLSWLAERQRFLDPQWTGVETWLSLLHFVLAVVLLTSGLRSRSVPQAGWIVLRLIIATNLLAAVVYSIDRYGVVQLAPGMLQYFAAAGLGPLDGLMLVGLGLLAARRYGVLALLLVLGGYSYFVSDSDYMFGYPLRTWTWLQPYLIALTLLYMVAAPAALLRARTRLGQAAAVFIPLLVFHAARIFVPLLAVGGTGISLPPGDVLLSANVLLCVWLAWILYSQPGEQALPAPVGERLVPDDTLEAGKQKLAGG